MKKNVILIGGSYGIGYAMAHQLKDKLAPSLTDTPLAKRLLSNESKREKMGERHPLKRMGPPEDIASMAVYLLSGKASWITGQVIGVDGGLSTLNLI